MESCCSELITKFKIGVITARKRSLGQGNIFTSVCQEFCSQGGACSLGGAWSRGCLVGGGLVLGGSGLGGAWSGGVPGGDTPQTATAAGGTHPTGMHSCYENAPKTAMQFMKKYSEAC